MKNILAENMLRFGVKNLSELSKHRLTETVVELMSSPGAAVALKSLKAQYKQGTKLPAVVMGQYYLKSTAEGTSAAILKGQVGGLNGKSFAGIGTLPVPANLTSTSGAEGGLMEYNPDPTGQWALLYWDNTIKPLPGTAALIAAELNVSCNQYPLTALTAMLAAHPKKAIFDDAITAFKASASPIKPLLTGNAKAFYGIV